MRCLCYAKFLSGGSIPLGEFFAHISTKWTCMEDASTVTNRNPNQGINHNSLIRKSIVFIADCKSVEQLTSELATLPGAGIANFEVFPVPEMLEYP